MSVKKTGLCLVALRAHPPFRLVTRRLGAAAGHARVCRPQPLFMHLISLHRLRGVASSQSFSRLAGPLLEPPWAEFAIETIMASLMGPPNGLMIPDKRRSVARLLSSVVPETQLRRPDSSARLSHGQQNKVSRTTLRVAGGGRDARRANRPPRKPRVNACTKYSVLYSISLQETRVVDSQ